MSTRLDYLFSDPVYYVMLVFVVVASIVLHELGHALAATWEGDPTPRIRGHLTWNPVVHMGWVSLVLIAVVGIGWGMTPVTPSMFRHRRWGSVIVSAAGPAVNLGLAFAGALMLAAMVRAHSDVDGRIFAFWELVLTRNTMLFLLNMIPVPPLDGFSVVDGTFDLGELGARMRQAGMLVFIVAVLIVNTDAFNHVIVRVIKWLFAAAHLIVGS